MSRRKQERPDSLEMLLDTMCNAFGGIILIAILLALLARTYDNDPGEGKPDPDEARRERDGRIATNRLAGATAVAEELAVQVAGIDPAKTNQWNTLTNLTFIAGGWSNKVVRMDGSGGPMAEAQAEAMSISNKIDQLDIMIASAKTELERWKGKEGDAKDNREQIKVRAPNAKADPSREPVIIVIQDGKILPLQKYNLDIDIRFGLKKADGKVEIRPGTGWPLPKTPPLNWNVFPRIAQYFNNFPKNNRFCSLYVDDNSFAEARVLRAKLAAIGLKVGWKPIFSKPLVFTSGTGGKGNIPD